MPLAEYALTPQLNNMTSPYQDVALLLKLRNALVHFKPEWDNERKEHEKLSNQLKGRFGVSPFLTSEPVFPKAWASHSCSAWAVKSSIAFVESFEIQAGLPKRLEKFKQKFVHR